METEEKEELTATVGESPEGESELVEGYEPFREVYEQIEKKEYDEALRLLNSFEERGADWYYAESVIYRKKGWFSDCRKSLKKAIKMDPENSVYAAALDELEAISREEKGRRKRHGTGASNFGGACAEGCCECGAMVCCELACSAICEGCG